MVGGRWGSGLAFGFLWMLSIIVFMGYPILIMKAARTWLYF